MCRGGLNKHTWNGHKVNLDLEQQLKDHTKYCLR